MSRAKGQHSVDRCRAPCGRTRNGLLAHNQAKGGNSHRLEHTPHNGKKALLREGPNQTGEIHRGGERGGGEVGAFPNFLADSNAVSVVGRGWRRVSLPGSPFL